MFLYWTRSPDFPAEGGASFGKCPAEHSSAAGKPFFYAWGQPDYLWLLLVSILANYLIGVLLASRKGGLSAKTGRLFLLIAGIVLNLGILGYYKYFNFFANTLNRVLGRQLLEMRQIALPLGVSFLPFRRLPIWSICIREKSRLKKYPEYGSVFFLFPENHPGSH